MGAGDVTFNSTPLMIGVAALAAGIVGRRQRLVPIGLTLAGWGLAVLLVRDGPLPDDRAAPAYLVGMGVGLLAAHVVARAWRVSLTGALISALAGGLSFYAAYDVEALNRWPLWAGRLGGLVCRRGGPRSGCGMTGVVVDIGADSAGGRRTSDARCRHQADAGPAKAPYAQRIPRPDRDSFG